MVDSGRHRKLDRLRRRGPTVDGEAEQVAGHRAFIFGRGGVIAVAGHDAVPADRSDSKLGALHPLGIEGGDGGAERHRLTGEGAVGAVEVNPGVGGCHPVAAGDAQEQRPKQDEQSRAAKCFPCDLWPGCAHVCWLLAGAGQNRTDKCPFEQSSRLSVIPAKAERHSRARGNQAVTTGHPFSRV